MTVRSATLTRPAAPGRLNGQQRGATAIRWRTRILLALGSAVLTAVAFPPTGWWWAGPLSVASLTLATRGASARMALATGGVAGGVSALIMLSWLRAVGMEAVVAMGLMMAGWWGLMGVALALMQRFKAWPLLIPAVWVLQEQLRSSWPWGGFPWGRLGFTVLDSPLESLVPYLGASGMTFVVAVLGCTTAASMGAVRRHRPLRAAVVAVAMLAVLIAIALAFPGTASAASSRDMVVVAAVQGGPVAGRDRADEARRVLDAHVRQTLTLAAGFPAGVDLVVWPESASDLDPDANPEVRRQISLAVDQLGAPVIVGAVTTANEPDGTLRNSAILWMPGTGPSQRYSKRNLVPFGEFVPSRPLLAPWSGRLGLPLQDFVPGSQPGILAMDRARVGILMCFEVAFDDTAREVIRAGATLLAIPSNNATYSRTWEPEQQLAMARFRALEFDRSIIVASTTGPSAAILPDGSVAGRVDDGSAGSVVATLPLRSGTTLAAEWGGPLAVMLSVVGAAFILFAITRIATARRSRARARNDGGSHAA